MEKWMMAAKKADFNRIGQIFHVRPVLARIMVNRGIKTDEEIQKYLYGNLEDLYDPESMKDLKKGVDRIAELIRNHQKVCIASDFDVDGVFAGYILWRGIQRCGGQAYVEAPDRIMEGYGLNERIVQHAHESGAKCILTCDNGIAALEPIRLAKSLGLQVIVTDHHEVIYRTEIDAEGNEHRIYQLPCADAVIDPKQSDCAYPFKGLCGAGVAFKFIEVLYKEFGISKEELYELVPFAAIATVADVTAISDVRSSSSVTLFAMVAVLLSTDS